MCLLYLQTGVRCMDCGYLCHERCADSVPAHCTKYKGDGGGGGAAGGGGGGGLNASQGGGNQGGLMPSGSDQPSSLHHQDTPSVNSSKILHDVSHNCKFSACQHTSLIFCWRRKQIAVG